MSAIVPYELTGKQTTAMTIVNQGVRSTAVTLEVAASTPGVYTSDGSGQALALNEDGTVNSARNPAQSGSTMSLYLTGGGQTNPGGVDGQIAASPLPTATLPVSVTLNGVPLAVTYVGVAPSMVEGAMQINFVTPGMASTGPAEVVVTIGASISQTGVTISVE